ncbi:oxygenase MpaB family protein [Gordonia polyisoprenivorans]|uniref:oxygenase MpaB family protein n=1 Tax=Gordonia polyisoprenivorans TaxID=84595 RepID=UPI0003A816DE|nr:oxygenase MpaB family protein [Gordonia polyisoprenivorans]
MTSARSGAARIRLDETSLLWRFLADRRFVMSICRAVSLQMLHPSIAAATHEFSIVPRRVFVHKQRTVPCIIRSGYDAGFDEVRLIRYSHDSFRGRRPDGRAYHALNPSVFFFEHATYVDALFTCVEVFFGGLDADDKRRLYDETCEWYRRYGISAREMPASLDDFGDYFTHALATELDPVPGLDWYWDQLLRPDYWLFQQLPTRAVRAIQHPVAAQMLGITVSAADRRALSRFAGRLRTMDAVRPRRNIHPDDLADKVLAARRSVQTIAARP